MNDVPAVVAWILAVPVAALVAVAWRLLRRLPSPGTPRWRRRALGWAGAAAVAGPLVVVPVLVLLGTLVDWRARLADPGQAIVGAVGAVLYLGVWYLFVSVAFFALPYVPLLLLWARLGPALGRLEASRRGVAASAALLALPGALAAVAAYGLLDEPFGFAGTELLRFGLVVLGSIAVGLLVPRLACPCLRPGTFAAPPSHSTSEIRPT